MELAEGSLGFAPERGHGHPALAAGDQGVLKGEDGVGGGVRGDQLLVIDPPQEKEKFRLCVETRADAEAWTEKAKDSIGLLPAHPVRDMLSDLADYVVARIS